FPFAAGSAAGRKLLNLDGLAIGIILAGLGELRLFGGKFPDDLIGRKVFSFGRMRVHSDQVKRRRKYSKQTNTHISSSKKTPPLPERFLLAKQLLGNGYELYIARSFIDPADLRVSVKLLDRVFLGYADPSKDLNRLGRHLLGDLRTVVFGHGRF